MQFAMFFVQENINFVVDDNNDDDEYCTSGRGRTKVILRMDIVKWLHISWHMLI